MSDSASAGRGGAIRFDRVAKTYIAGEQNVEVFDSIDASLPSDKRVVILGHRGVGKSTFIKLLAGLTRPSHGKIEHELCLSFPVGYVGGLRSRLSVRENLAYAARIFGADVQSVVGFVDYALNLGPMLKEEVRHVPPDRRKDLGYALAYAIPFDVYLADGRLESGEERVRAICRKALRSRLQTAGLILTTSNVRVASEIAEIAGVINEGRLELFDDVGDAIGRFKSLKPDSAKMDTAARRRKRRLALAEEDDEESGFE